jgi:hypothetical protein
MFPTTVPHGGHFLSVGWLFDLKKLRQVILKKWSKHFRVRWNAP